jgi:hypothetical protein
METGQDSKGTGAQQKECVDRTIQQDKRKGQHRRKREKKRKYNKKKRERNKEKGKQGKDIRLTGTKGNKHWIRVSNQDSMEDIRGKIQETLGIEATAYWTTHNGRKLPDANKPNSAIGSTLEQGGDIQIKVRGKGGSEENEKTLLSKMLEGKAGKRRRARGLILESVRANGQTVPCTVTWESGDEEATRKIRKLIQDYLELAKVKCKPGTTEAERKTAEN